LTSYVKNKRQRKLQSGLSNLTLYNFTYKQSVDVTSYAFTGQLLERENPKQYSSYYLKNLFCEALENRPTLFTQIRPRCYIIWKYTSAINFRRILKEAIVFQQVVSFNINMSPLIFNSASHNIWTSTAFHIAAKVTKIFYL
jgi:hypothetical protein